MQQAQLQHTAQRLAEVFQRSSSHVEGRNGYLSLRNHQLRGLDHPRKRAWLTAMHNFFLTRADGTTAAERFFGQQPRTSEAIVHTAGAEGYGVQRFDGRALSSSGAHNADAVWPRPDKHASFLPPVCPFWCDRTYGNSKRFRRAAPVARPSHGGAK